jgi:ABC-2 type transport system permease protein
MVKKYTNGAREIADIFSKEIKLIFTDSGTVLIFLIAMFIYPLIYSLGYENETIRELPVAVVDLDHSQLSRQYSRMADATEQMQITCKPGSLKEAESLFYDGEVKGVILIPCNFERDVLNARQTNVTVYCDASYFMLYKQVYAGTTFSGGTFGAGVEIKRLLAEGKTMEQAKDMQDPLKVSTYNLYNPASGYGSFVMPGMVLIIMQQTLLLGIGMIGGTAREKKKFLKRTHLVIRKWGNVKLIIGKALAYVSIYALTAFFAVGILPKWFSFPCNGNFWLVAVLLIPYLLSISFLGLSISLLFKQRVHSMLFLVFVSPMVVFLSGISWPTSSIPPLLHAISNIFPSTVLIPAYLRVQVANASFASVQFEWFMLIIQMTVYFILACVSYKISLKRFGAKIGSNYSVSEG